MKNLKLFFKVIYQIVLKGSNFKFQLGYMTANDIYLNPLANGLLKDLTLELQKAAVMTCKIHIIVLQSY